MKTQLSFNNLRRCRKARGLTQTQVARILGLQDHNRLSNWERGKCLPSVAHLFRLAAVYHTTADTLYIDMARSMREEISERKRTMDINPHRQKKLHNRPSREEVGECSLGSI
jgi:transcriptional regulator with XRE-family HTH domain